MNKHLAVQAAFECGVMDSSSSGLILREELIPGFPGLMNLIIGLLWQASNPSAKNFQEARAYIGTVFCADKGLLATIAGLALQMNKPLFQPQWARLIGENGNLNDILRYVNAENGLKGEREPRSLIFCKYLETSPQLKAAVRISLEHGLKVQKITGLIDRGKQDNWLCNFETGCVFQESSLLELAKTSVPGA